MIEARHALPGQSTPGPDACSLATARADNASSVSAVRHPAWGTSGSSAPPAASRPRATSADRSTGQPPGRSACSARPCRRQPGASRPGAQPASAALQAPSTRCSAAAASATSAGARLAHLCRSDRGHRIPGTGALLRPSAHLLTAFISAAVCAFSVTSRVAQRDGVAGRGHAEKPHLAAPRRPGTHWRAPPRRSGGLTACRSLARWMMPGWHPSACPGSPRVPRHPVGSRPSRRRPRVPAASGRPGRGSPAHPCAVTHDQPYREGRRAACGMHDGRGCQRHGNPGRPCRRHESKHGSFVRCQRAMGRQTASGQPRRWFIDPDVIDQHRLREGH
jgi:hypothetical protein